MAERKEIAGTLASEFTLSASEKVALVNLLDKASSEMAWSSQHQYEQVGQFIKLFALDSKPGSYRVSI